MKIEKNLPWAIFIFGIILISINFFGLTQSIRHPDMVSYDKFGSQFTPLEIRAERFTGSDAASVNMTRENALQEAKKILQLTDEHQKIKEIQKLVTASMVHFYPVNKPYLSNYFHVPIYENFILYLGVKLFELTDIKALSVFRPYEYLNGKKSWERGAAMCGEMSSVAMYLMDEAGIENGKAGLDGHVIALARTSDGAEYVVDADYGFILEGSLSDIAQNSLDEVEKLSGSKHLANIYGPEGNIEFWTGDRGYRPKGYWFERISYILKWAIPICLIIFPLLLVFIKSNKKND
jgi:hypothetical protein